MPRPSFRRLSGPSACSNSLRDAATWASVMPEPVSDTRIRTRPSPGSDQASTPDDELLAAAAALDAAVLQSLVYTTEAAIACAAPIWYRTQFCSVSMGTFMRRRPKP